MIIVIIRNIYIFGVCTEKPYSEPLERNVVYIAITTSSDVSDIKINYGSLVHVSDPQLEEKLRVIAYCFNCSAYIRFSVKSLISDVPLILCALASGIRLEPSI